VQEYVLSILGDLLMCFETAFPMIVCVSTRSVAPTMKVAPRTSQASQEGGCGVAGWQGLKMDSGDIADLMPHFMRRSSGVEDNSFPRRGG
jgi:hypothetical protein